MPGLGLQSCPRGTPRLRDGISRSIAPLDSSEQRSFCFQPDRARVRTAAGTATATMVHCHTECNNPASCDPTVNEHMPGDAALRVEAYGAGATTHRTCTSATFYDNDEYCSVWLDPTSHYDGVLVTVANTLSNTPPSLDWAGKLRNLSITCSTHLPVCPGATLALGVPSRRVALPAYDLPTKPRQVRFPPVHRDFCLTEGVTAGTNLTCTVQCNQRGGDASSCGEYMLALDRNYPGGKALCRERNAACRVTIDPNTERVVARLSAAPNRGAASGLTVTCTADTETVPSLK